MNDYRALIVTFKIIGLICSVNMLVEVVASLMSNEFPDVLITTPNRLVYLLREDDSPPLNLSK